MQWVNRSMWKRLPKLIMAAAWLIASVTPAVHATGATNVPKLLAEKVVVQKAQRRLLLFANGSVLRSYRIALGRNPDGHKTQMGDGRTPVGSYVLDWRNTNSRFHRAIHISYPNADDRVSAHKRNVDPGGAIMIHGLPNGRGAIGPDHTKWDWTDGCIAVTNREMDEIWSLIPNGIPIQIRP